MEIILSVDYEIFGDGSGDCKHCRIRPSRRLLEVLEVVDEAECTFFVDYGEIRAKRRMSRKLNGTASGDGIRECLSETEQQLKEIVERGHDVQLHIHPQWLDAEFEGGRWTVSRDGWSIPSVVESYDYDFLSSLFHEAREYFTDLLKPVDASYDCSVFRAGGWAIQPSRQVLSALRENNFVVDSSVVPGMRKDGYDYTIDYSEAPRNRTAWRVDETITEPDAGGELLEVPISSLNLWGFQRLVRENVIARKWGDAYPAGCEGTSFDEGLGFLDYMKWLFTNQHTPLDFCHFRTPALVEYVERFLKSGKELVVMMGHTKEFHDTDGFRSLLNELEDRSVGFTNYRDFYEDFMAPASSESSTPPKDEAL